MSHCSVRYGNDTGHFYRGIDISVGSVMALAGVMTAKLMPETGLVPAILLAVAASVLVGCIAGFFCGSAGSSGNGYYAGTYVGSPWSGSGIMRWQRYLF